MTKSEIPQITITRCAVQAMLRHAIDSQPAICCGLVSGKDMNIRSTAVIRNIANHPEQQCRPSKTDMDCILHNWQKQGLDCRGAYCSSLHPGDMRSEDQDNNLVDMAGKFTSPHPQLYLAINLDIEGRLETHAYKRHENTWRELPLVLATG